ncbi:MAG: radical SAM protein [Deltaproteobacteria bacterium CG11_big_fil_rev_8_21_14_0_20_47_16]|nr:MAG: radical SAM protein [Deltaproteobacteria bacterium CG11_big_fil_rev_8_21_14_0_20_47_16]
MSKPCTLKSSSKNQPHSGDEGEAPSRIAGSEGVASRGSAETRSKIENFAESNKLAPIIDTHCHIGFSDYDADRAEVLQRAWDAGLESIIMIGAGQGIEGNQKTVDLTALDERLFATIGVHPHDAEKLTPDVIAEFEKLAKHDRVVAIGEIGLDYHYDHAPRNIQQEAFRRQLELASHAGLPVTIHSRDADADTYAILREFWEEIPGGVMHCFGGNVEAAKACFDMGFYISIPGIVTFKKAEQLQDVVRACPVEKMLIETDAPYLAPIPYRGKRNEPSYVAEVAKAIAEIKGLAYDDVARITTLNAKRLFRLPGATMEPQIAYAIRDSLYLNITNKCTLACKFCPKFKDWEVKGYYLRLPKEPDLQDILRAMGDTSPYKEVVFCGYGEPTKRLELLKAIAGELKKRGIKVRLNTDGLGNLTHNRNILPELKGLIDAMSVSLNAANPQDYVKWCPNKYGEAAYPAVKAFIKEATQYIPEVIASVVTVPGLDVDECRSIVENELGARFRDRPFNEVG